ncbi:hypothetical protein [Nocardia amamiensis]|uniref:hypothetical protein n=1 Tax=Nocardia amamiensis TaxID=404578 RepID=UPI0033DE89A0
MNDKRRQPDNMESQSDYGQARQRALREFCTSFTMICSIKAVLIVLMRAAIVQVNGGGPVPALFVLEERVCSIALLIVAALLFRVRSRIGKPDFPITVSRTLSCVIACAVICGLGILAVFAVPLRSDVALGAYPTIVASAMALSGMAMVCKGLTAGKNA